MNDKIKNDKIKFLLLIKVFVSSLLILGGVIGILLPPFFSYSGDYSNEVLPATVTPSVTTVIVSAPTGLTALAVSSSQVNLNWNSVTGAVSYKVYRGGNLIGSSATTSYSDVGLSPATTYSYTVSAVDTFGSESAQSSSASATTLAAEVVEEGGGPSFIPPSLPKITSESLIINEGAVYANSLGVILTLSAENAFQLAISNTPDFAGVPWESFQTPKKWILAEGDGKKIVYVKFRSSEGGVSEVVSDSIILDTVPPVNVGNLGAIAGDGKINLSWKNPPDKDFKGVRIMRSTVFYPTDPSEGVLVYDGKGTSFVDTGLENNIIYYYTAFSYDKAENYSSGAIVSATPFKIKPPPPPPPLPPPPLPPEIEELTFKDFDFIQEDKKLPLIEDKIEIKPEKPLTISIDYKKVPEVLKTIMITLRKEEKSFSFLLRVNKEKTKYLATLLPLEPAIYSLSITVLDYKNQAFKKIPGQLEVEKIVEVRPLRIPWPYILFGIGIMVMIYLVWRLRFRPEVET